MIAEFRAVASYSPRVAERAPWYRDSYPAFRASSDKDSEARSGRRQAPLAVAALTYAAASLAEILFFGAVATAALALLIVALTWIV